MMNKKTLTLSLLASAVFVAGIAAPAAAQVNTPNIDRTQVEINARIQQGLTLGYLTPSEAQGLMQRERELQRREYRIKSDGVATPQERAQLRNDLAALRDEVERKMANGEVALRRNPQPATPGIDNFEARIDARIEQGITSGHITRGEARMLRDREREIQRREARFKADGVISESERRQLRRDLRALQDQVEALMNNDRRAGRAYRS